VPHHTRHDALIRCFRRRSSHFADGSTRALIGFDRAWCRGNQKNVLNLPHKSYDCSFALRL
jgi:hypothetical protein